MFKVHTINDSLDKYKIEHPLFNVPFRGLVLGKSNQGKTLIICNLVLMWFKNAFKADDIYLFLGSKDEKYEFLIDKKNIPRQNVKYEFDEDYVNKLYNKLEKEHEFNIEEKKRRHYLIIIDDFGFSNKLTGKSNNSVINRLYQNGRHYNISTISIYQKLASQASTAVRNNLTFGIFFKTTNKEKNLIAEEFNYIKNDKSNEKFLKLFDDCVDQKHSTFTVNMSKGFNDINKLYMCNFEFVNMEKYLD